MKWIIGWIVHFFREATLRVALRSRNQEIGQSGLNLWHAYILCTGNFKPGAKERMENEMEVLHDRIQRIRRRLRRGWFTRRKQLGTPPPLTPEEKRRQAEIDNLKQIEKAARLLRDSLRDFRDGMAGIARTHEQGQGMGRISGAPEQAGRGSIETTGTEVASGDRGTGQGDLRPAQVAQGRG